MTGQVIAACGGADKGKVLPAPARAVRTPVRPTRGPGEVEGAQHPGRRGLVPASGSER